MDLQIFRFTEDVLDKLEEMKIDLDIASREIEQFFEMFLEGAHEGYLNVMSRVKSKPSLKEKILRHDYYKKYKNVETLYENLSDLIGVRLECRFIEDEIVIFEAIESYFTIESEQYKGYFGAGDDNRVLLELGSGQPKHQKNGITMYRIDGKYLYNGAYLNFEVQIKSLVNIFWGEIEHKIIYKNYNYIIADKFYKDIMESIKNSLTTIDQQLLLISNQFDRANTVSVNARSLQMEKSLSKVIYDVFAIRMKNDIGLLVDFRKSCDTIVRYVFRENLKGLDSDYNKIFMKALNRLGEIDEEEICFNTELLFEREVQLEDEFSNILGSYMKESINEEFQWNLFFRILFHIEPKSNVEDFEKFIIFYRERIQKGLNINKLEESLSPDFVEKIIGQIINKIAYILVKVDSVEILYDTMIEQMIDVTNDVIGLINKNVLTYSEWRGNRLLYLELLEVRILSLFDVNIDSAEVLDLLETIRSSEADIPIHKSVLAHINKL